jgi:DNA-binding transcriptional ArsR family regulator
MRVPPNSDFSLKAKLFRGLADPSRLAIIEAVRSGAKTVSEIVAATTLSQPNVSAHLVCLKDCGLVASRQEGKFVFYALGDLRLEALFQAAEGILSGTAERISCCSNYECQTANKCVRDKECVSSARVVPPALRQVAVKIPLAANKIPGDNE